MSIVYSNKSFLFSETNTGAKGLNPEDRKNLALSALAGTTTISGLAQEASTSRKFIYKQQEIASTALDAAFAPIEKDSTALFYIPVTKQWIEQTVLSLVLICHSSYSGVVEFFRDILNLSTCKGSVYNIVYSALGKAREINNAQDLSLIKVGAHDEIFQCGKPVLVGCDVQSTYTYLLKLEEHRDSTTWGVRLLDLEGQGMQLNHTIADGGNGLRSGQREAWPDVPCWGDVFHPLYDIGKVVTFLENRAKSTQETVRALEKKITRAKRKNKGAKYSRNLGHARKEAIAAVLLRDDISTLSDWLKNDILSVSGPDMAARQELLDFIVEELLIRESKLAYRIRPVRRLLENQGADLLRFVEPLDIELKGLADTHGIDVYWVRQIFELQSVSVKKNLYWEKARALQSSMKGCFYAVEKAIHRMIEETVRASSMVENLNSRLRNYFFLRKTLGNDYLELLQFFLNHRRYMRSSRSERVGKSPTELLTSESHSHWLELLGYQLFKSSHQIPKSAERKAA